MGLDMYAYAIKADLVEGLGDVDVKVTQAAAEPYMAKDSHLKRIDAKEMAERNGDFNPKFWYWRKFNHLHGWMEQLYIDKGGTQEFNCTTVRLRPNDLAALQQAMEEGTLTHRSGFFFGGEEIHPADLEDLQDFLNRANQAIEDGYAVFYDSWW